MAVVGVPWVGVLECLVRGKGGLAETEGTSKRQLRDPWSLAPLGAVRDRDNSGQVTSWYCLSTPSPRSPDTFSLSFLSTHDFDFPFSLPTSLLLQSLRVDGVEE
jgi:hypothetical protein